MSEVVCSHLGLDVGGTPVSACVLTHVHLCMFMCAFVHVHACVHSCVFMRVCACLFLWGPQVTLRVGGAQFGSEHTRVRTRARVPWC